MWYILALMLTGQPPALDPLVHARDVNIEGIYMVEGYEGTEKYIGMCSIKMIDGSKAYHFVNVCGRSTVEGIGIRTDNSVAFSWTDGKVHGVSLFSIRNGSLHGQWTVSGVIHEEYMKLLSAWPSEE